MSIYKYPMRRIFGIPIENEESQILWWRDLSKKDFDKRFSLSLIG